MLVLLIPPLFIENHKFRCNLVKGLCRITFNLFSSISYVNRNKLNLLITINSLPLAIIFGRLNGYLCDISPISIDYYPCHKKHQRLQKLWPSVFE